MPLRWFHQISYTVPFFDTSFISFSSVHQPELKILSCAAGRYTSYEIYQKVNTVKKMSWTLSQLKMCSSISFELSLPQLHTINTNHIEYSNWKCFCLILCWNIYEHTNSILFIYTISQLDISRCKINRETLKVVRKLLAKTMILLPSDDDEHPSSNNQPIASR